MAAVDRDVRELALDLDLVALAVVPGRSRTARASAVNSFFMWPIG